LTRHKTAISQFSFAEAFMWLMFGDRRGGHKRVFRQTTGCMWGAKGKMISDMRC
jgi:hypothetical protein